MDSVLEGVTNYIKDNDAMVEPFYQKLHGTNDNAQKTLCGGVMSLVVSFYVYYIAYTQGLRMINFDGPGISS